MLCLAIQEVVTLIESINIKIWDRDFYLPVVYDCYTGENVTDEQINALDMFLKKPKLIIKSKQIVIKFCSTKVNEDKTNQKKDNIFSYIKPEAIFVKRDEKKPRVALMCKYKYDLEHGLAIVFDYKGNIEVGLQDIIL